MKRYSAEVGTPRIVELFSGEFILGCSELGVIELTATFARKQIASQIDRALFAAFKSATYIAGTCGLRGADSIHLASAMSMASYMMDRHIVTIFVSSGRDLNPEQ